MLVLLAGHIGPLVSLAECLRQMHAESVEENRAERTRREAAGIPLDDVTVWPDVQTSVAGIQSAIERRDSAAVRTAINAASALVAAPIGEVAPLELSDAEKAVRVSFRVCSEEQRSAAMLAVGAAYDADMSSPDARVARARAILAEKMKFLALCVDRVEGLSTLVEGEERPIVIRPGADASHDDLLVRMQLLQPLFSCAAHVQRLDAKKNALFGQLPPST